MNPMVPMAIGTPAERRNAEILPLISAYNFLFERPTDELLDKNQVPLIPKVPTLDVMYKGI